MRLVFLGSDAIALPALEFLRAAPGVQLAGVITQPDRPSGRGRHLHANTVAQWARAQEVPILQPLQPGAADLAWLREQRVDVALVMAYGRILREDFLGALPCGVWNLHGSLLPAYRGASPVEAALALGETETGVCLMRVVPALDAGPVADAERVPIHAADTGAALRERLARACVPLLERNLSALADGSLQAVPQDESRVSYTRKLTKADAHLDFSLPAVELERRVRALQPWPGAMIDQAGECLKVGEAVAVPEEPATSAPGTVLQAGEAGADIATGQGVLRLLALQRPGGRMLGVAEFLRGHALSPGTLLIHHAPPPLVSPRPFPRPAPVAAPKAV
jgi:methionyl-tRNA formyltransferase